MSTEPVAAGSATPAEPPRPERLVSLDAYRGLTMLFMASGGLGLAALARGYPSDWLQSLAWHTTHVPWIGCSAWDLIQPSFMFMVGVSMPYSYARRRERGDSFAARLRHAVVRSLVLVALGIALRSVGEPQINFIFTDVLTQIGLGYTFVFLLVGRPKWVQAAALVAILAGYTLALGRYPPRDEGFDYTTVGISEQEHAQVVLNGRHAPWSKNVNLAADVDVWLLNQFQPPKPFKFQSGGYQTLNFIPSIATMLLGLFAGERLRGAAAPWAKLAWLVFFGAVCLLAGLEMHWHACPIVKRIWTPSWALASGGAALWILAALYAVVDVLGVRRWTYPLVVVGANSIATYVLYQLGAKGLQAPVVKRWLAALLAQPYGLAVQSVCLLAVLWLIDWWLYRRKIFVRI